MEVIAMNRLRKFTITGLFLLLSFLGLAGCYTFPERYPYEEDTSRYRQEQPVYDYEYEYEQSVRYRASEPRAYHRRELPPWSELRSNELRSTEEHERAWQRRGFSQNIGVDDEAPIYLGLTPMPQRGASAGKASEAIINRQSTINNPRTEKAKEKREPQSQQQNVFILVFPSQEEIKVAQEEKKAEERNKKQKIGEKIEATKAEAPEKQELREKESVLEIPQQSEKRASVKSSAQSRQVSGRSHIKPALNNEKSDAQGTKPVVQKEEIALQPPTPPDYINFWLYILNGTLHGHRYASINYPGKIRVESYRREGGLVVVTLASTFDPKVKWKLVLPREDGEHNVKAILVSK
jgi:hypothetical protein